MKISANIYLFTLIVLIFASAFVSFNRYVVKRDFVFFTTEESIPGRFSLESYSHL